jgi:molybdenum cofactor guanylyltransferase
MVINPSRERRPKSSPRGLRSPKPSLSAILRVYHLSMEGASPHHVSVFILAGGHSTRMGSDKAFLLLNERTLLARALDLALSVTTSVYIVGRAEKFAAFAPVLEDVYRDCGPLGGIHAALQATSTELNLILAVDTPFVPHELLRYLIKRAQSAPWATATIPRTAGGWQPLCGVYRREFAVSAESALRAHRYKIDALFEVVETQVIDDEELAGAGFSPRIFRNLNTKEELEAALMAETEN